MNKYQEALNQIKHELYAEEDDYNVSLMQELVDKATPKKPYKQMMTSCLEGANSNRTAIYQLSCRNCDSTFEENCDDLNCRYCGQAMDWSEE